MTIGLIDMIVLGILIFSVFFALYRGLVSELLGISAWILAGFGALYSYSPMQPVMHRFIENEKIAGICGAFLVGLLILVVMTFINAHIGHKLRQSALSGLDRLLGLGFGLLRGVLLVALLYMGISFIVSDEYMDEIKKENVSIPYIEKTVQIIKNLVPQNVRTDLGMSEEETEEKPKKIGVDLKREHKLPDHKKAVKRFVEEVKKDVTEKVAQKTEEKVKAKVTEKVTQKAEEQSKTKPVEKVTQKTSDKSSVKGKKKENVKKTTTVPSPQYDEKQRESLDNMVEQLMEKGE